MADEENPLGGGAPFGIGPFGPLVAAAAVAAATIGGSVSVTTGRAVCKPLHYQAKVFVAVPPDILVAPVATAESFAVTTGQNSRRTLFYQANIAPPAFIQPAEVVVANLSWHAPFSAPPPRKLVLQRQLNQPFTPSAAPKPDVAWLQPFRRQVAGPFPVHTQPVLGYAAAPQPTPDEWLQPFRRAVPIPPPIHTQPVSGYQPEAVVSNLTTTLEWLQPFNVAVPQPSPALSQPVFGYPYEAAVVSNLTTSLEWMVAWQKAVPAQPVHYTQPVHAQPTPNLTATLEWQTAWQKAVPTPPVRHTQPIFGYPYPTVENTITGLGWIYRFEKAVPVPAVHHTQPVFGYPYEGVDNTRAEWDWSIAWQGPPRTLQRLAAGPVYPLPPSNYRNEWDWPLAWNFAAKAPKPVHTQPVSGYPYVTVENTITGIAWLYRFEKAVPVPPVNHTQPVFGYPYESVAPPSNLTTSIEWLQKWQGPGRALQRLAAGPVLPPAATPTVANTITGMAWLQAWKGPPRYWPIKVQQTPFIPKEFVQDQITPDKWLLGFQKAVPAPKPIHTQPFLGRSYAAPPTLEWLQAWKKAQAPKPIHTQPVYGYPYEVAVVANTVTIDKWQQPFTAAKARAPVHTQPAITHYPIEVVACDPAFQHGALQFDAFQTCQGEELETPPQTEFSAEVIGSIAWRKTLYYQAWAFGYPYEQPPPPPQAFSSISVTWTELSRKSLFYQSWAVGYEPPPLPPEPEPPPPPLPPKHSHGHIDTATAATVFTGTVSCVPAFPAGEAFQANAFQTCEGTPAVSVTFGMRTPRTHTSSRWRRSRGNIRSRGKSRTTPRDDP